ncbi:uncharacterized protein RHO25_005830 [Cercospora beticola]|uniref:DNA replication factor Cdt1 C-terminal domain-containing protein n=1 Tax=Cercospora beticola TaxID=122368 RepID=A0ABZ0NNT3_CERBT|nr:hypothetical protein RHO25_005830 [Cercospora beticola]
MDRTQRSSANGTQAPFQRIALQLLSPNINKAISRMTDQPATTARNTPTTTPAAAVASSRKRKYQSHESSAVELPLTPDGSGHRSRSSANITPAQPASGSSYRPPFGSSSSVLHGEPEVWSDEYESEDHHIRPTTVEQNVDRTVSMLSEHKAVFRFIRGIIDTRILRRQQAPSRPIPSVHFGVSNQNDASRIPEHRAISLSEQQAFLGRLVRSHAMEDKTNSPHAITIPSFWLCDHIVRLLPEGSFNLHAATALLEQYTTDIETHVGIWPPVVDVLRKAVTSQLKFCLPRPGAKQAVLELPKDERIIRRHVVDIEDDFQSSAGAAANEVLERLVKND